MSTPPTSILRSDRFLDHDPGEGHPENAERLAAVYRSLDQRPIEGTTSSTPSPADHATIERVHRKGYVDVVAGTADMGRAQLGPETTTSPATYEAALMAVGATIEGVESVVEGRAHGAFALVRPPGHHAEATRAMGFCLFNNVAVAAEYALEEGGLRRVLVLDPDVHHGNGTQHAFWEREEVLYVSSHRWPFYPGTGSVEEIGAGPGRGHTVNLPLPAGGTDADLLHVYERVVDPIVREFHPELILVSAGFDTWQRDPLGGMRVTEAGFAGLFALFRRWADAYCPGRVVCTLEGGYEPVGVVAGVRAALEALRASNAPDARIEGPVSEATRRTVREARHELAPYWHALESAEA